MIYVICVLKSSIGKITSYRLLDTCSDSTMIVGPQILREIMINTNIKIVNAITKDNKIILKGWARGLGVLKEYGYDSTLSGAKYVLLATRDNARYKVVRSEDGSILNIEPEHFKGLANIGEIANYSRFTKTKDTYSIKTDKEFEASIYTKYKSFLAKALLLGLGDLTLDYEIENHEVRLRRYTGKTKNVILPPFITAIMTNAFKDTEVETIKCNSGLKVIGAKAFAHVGYEELERVEISETVELVGEEAFMGNYKLNRHDIGLNTDRVKILNNKTFLIDNYIW